MLYIVLFVMVFVIAADQAIKLIVVNTLEVGQSVPWIEGVFHFTFVENFGAAFSILQDRRIFLVSVVSITLLIIFIFLIKNIKKLSKPTCISIALVLGGGIGNLIDRIRFGYVVDFFDFRAINYPVFNFADCCVVLGAIILIISVLLSERNSTKKEK